MEPIDVSNAAFGIVQRRPIIDGAPRDAVASSTPGFYGATPAAYSDRMEGAPAAFLPDYSFNAGRQYRDLVAAPRFGTVIGIEPYNASRSALPPNAAAAASAAASSSSSGAPTSYITGSYKTAGSGDLATHGHARSMTMPAVPDYTQMSLRSQQQPSAAPMPSYAQMSLRSAEARTNNYAQPDI